MGSIDEKLIETQRVLGQLSELIGKTRNLMRDIESDAIDVLNLAKEIKNGKDNPPQEEEEPGTES